jgi:hypothetical protein
MDIRDVYSSAICISDTVRSDTNNISDNLIVDINEEKYAYMGIFDGYKGYGRELRERNIFPDRYISSAQAAKSTNIFLHNNDLTFSEKDAKRLTKKITENGSIIRESYMNKYKKEKDIKYSDGTPASAVIAAVKQEDESLVCEYMWHGAARGYILNSKGLCQVTGDSPDFAIREFYRAGDEEDREDIFDLRYKKICISLPAVVILASDGAYSAYRKPMNFEGLILRAMAESESTEQMESKIKSELFRNSNDDFTLSALIFGYQDFAAMKSDLAGRCRELVTDYLMPQKKILEEGGDEYELDSLWTSYKQTYYRF